MPNYEHIITLRILTDRDAGEVTGIHSAAALLHECFNGDFVGELVSGVSRQVSDAAMADMLVAAGSEPGFFNLPDLSDLARGLDSSASTEDCDSDSVLVSRAAFNDLMRAVGMQDSMLEEEEVGEAKACDVDAILAAWDVHDDDDIPTMRLAALAADTASITLGREVTADEVIAVLADQRGTDAPQTDN